MRIGSEAHRQARRSVAAMNMPSSATPVVRTTCPYCGVGCGVLAQPDGQGGAGIAGDPDHPANFGRLCSKGSALDETLGLAGRLLYPMLRRSDGSFDRIDWADALDRVSSGLQRIIARDGPDAVAFYLSGQLLTEDYYVANKLMKGFIGSSNVDTNSRLCMASSVVGHRRAFGSDTVPGTYEDLDAAELLILVGSNAAWCHPVLFQRMVRNKQERGAKIIVIDPRRTATAEEADLFLGIAPGMDTALFCGLLVHLADRHALDYRYIDAYTVNFENALARAREIAPDLAATAKITGLRPIDVERFFALFRSTSKTVTCFSQGVNQSARGTDKVNAIINCHLATGRIGRRGKGPFSLTGQPNAMGGREVGGLANVLAAHMQFTPEDIARVGRFWNAPAMAVREGPKAVAMFDAIARGEIKALWVMATNPAVSLPHASRVREALAKLELFVVSENVLASDTVNAGAQLLLPACAWGEKHGTVTNSERRISRQRAFLSAPGETRPDWWIVSQVARRLGFAAAFSYHSAAQIFREHAALSAFENEGRRAFDLGGLANISDGEFDALDPVQWPLCSGEDRHARKERRFFAAGQFYTPNRKACFIAPELLTARAANKAMDNTAISKKFPFRLNTGRVRDQWHSNDALRHKPTSRRTCAGAIRRSPSDGCHGSKSYRRRTCQGCQPLRIMRAQGGRQRPAATRLAVCSNSLERCNSLGRAHRRPCHARHRPSFGAAGLQGHAGIDRSRPLRVARVHAHASAHRPAAGKLVGPRCRRESIRAASGNQRSSRFLARRRAADARGRPRRICR